MPVTLIAADYAALEVAQDALVNLGQDLAKLFRTRCGRLVQDRIFFIAVHSLDDDAMKVDVEAQGTVEALNDIHRTGGWVVDAHGLAHALLPIEDTAHVDPTDRGAGFSIVGAKISQLEGQGQDPLAHGSVGEDVIEQMGGLLGHASGATAGTKASALAGEGEQLFGLAVRASHAGEAACQDAAVEKLLELTQNKTGGVATWVLCQQVAEGGEVLVDDPVEHLLLRVATDMR